MGYKVDFCVSDNFKDLESWVSNIDENFSVEGERVYKGRNEIRIYHKDGYILNVKGFKRPHFINRFVYGSIRKSKACRSYEYGNVLLSKGIKTPEPVGWCDVSKRGFVNRSYYISLHQPGDFVLRSILNEEILDAKERAVVLKEFVSFTYNKLHKSDVHHLDYSPGNVLITKGDDGKYNFAVVDLNRMEFCKMPYSKGLNNFSSLSTTDSILELVASEYAELNGEDPKKAISTLKSADIKGKLSRERRNKIKRFFKAIFS